MLLKRRTERSGRGIGWLGRAAGLLLITLALLALLEGGSSLLLAVYDSRPEPRFSEYHPELGWVSTPSVSEPDFWGPGRGVHTNAQRFRASGEVSSQMPPGTIRILCFGDSFTFADGVGDAEAWCRRLGEMDPKLESVNVGQPGYGLDQSYLRFRQVADSIEHAVALVGFIGDDFPRMRSRTRNGYDKPRLRLDGDSLAVENVPVPRIGPSIGRAVARFSERLRLVDLGQRGLSRLSRGPPAASEETQARLEETVRRVFADIARRSEAKGVDAVLVFFPTLGDLRQDARWRARAARLAAEAGLPLIDPTEAMRDLPRAEAEDLFIPLGAIAGGHYSRVGNAWMAQRIYDGLIRLPRIAERLGN